VNFAGWYPVGNSVRLWGWWDGMAWTYFVILEVTARSEVKNALVALSRIALDGGLV
jgi:hypothetical protein